MHSSAYIEFVERVEKDGYKQGYNEELFKLILPDEVNDVEKIVEEKFDNGDIHMAVFLPELRRCNGIKKLEEKAQLLSKTCGAYCEIMRVLYNSTNLNDYLDNLISVLNSDNKSDRMQAMMNLLKCGKSEKLYEVFRKHCIVEKEEDIRSRCVVGMFYCRNIIENPFAIQRLEQPWKRLKLEMYDCDRNKEERLQSILEFENTIGNCANC